VLTASCHCGAVSIRVARPPTELTACNCSICRRYAAHWAYYSAGDLEVVAPPGATCGYVWGDKRLRFVRCSTCGCVTHWEPVEPQPNARTGVNALNFDPKQLGEVRVRHLDGADTWEFLD